MAVKSCRATTDEPKDKGSMAEGDTVMFGSMFLDADTLAAISQGCGGDAAAALAIALAAEVCTLRRAFVSLLGVVETRYPAAREMVLQDLHEARAAEHEPPEGLSRNGERVNALDYLIDVLEMNLRPDQS